MNRKPVQPVLLSCVKISSGIKNYTFPGSHAMQILGLEQKIQGYHQSVTSQCKHKHSDDWRGFIPVVVT